MPSSVTNLSDDLVNNLDDSSQPKEETWQETYDSIATWGDSVKAELDTIIDTTIADLDAATAKLADDQVFEGSNTFEGETTFEGDITSESQITSSGQPRCMIYSTAGTQSIANNSYTSSEDLSFTSETYDVSGLFVPTSTTITVPSGYDGLYIIQAQVTFAVNATGIRRIGLYVNSTEVARVNTTDADATEDSRLQISFVAQLVSGNTIQCRAFQNSGGALNVTHGAANTWLSVTKIC